MARHRKQMHLHQSHFECHICNEEFTDINYFDAHKRSIQCRNNTRRKLEEEGLLQQQQEEEQQQQLELLNLQQQKQEVLLEDDVQEVEDETSQQYSQHSIDQEEHEIEQKFTHHLVDHNNDDHVQMIEEADIKHLLPSPHQEETATQFILSNELLQNHKIEVLTSDDVADDEELVYEITIDSNE